MKKIITTALFSFLTCFTGIVLVVRHYEPSVTGIPLRYMKVRWSSPDRTYTLFGPSYAAYLTLPGDRNLGTPGSYPREHIEMLKQIPKNSTPVYVCSFREVAVSDCDVKRTPFYNPWSYALWQVKVTVKHTRWRQTDPIYFEKMLHSARRKMHREGWLHFAEIKRIRPDTVIILTPVKDMPDDLSSEMRSMLADIGFMVFDFTDFAEPSGFVNTLHLKPEYIARLEEEIHDNLRRHQFPILDYQKGDDRHMIIFDGINHLCSTASEEELHRFARKLGLKREWFHDECDHPHYDLTTKNARRRAMAAGAVKVNFRVYLKIIWERGV